jgi:hypothetical protein
MRLTITLGMLVIAGSAHAAPAPRPGANHHLGDDSWIAKFGHAPEHGDSEKARMKTHLEFVRAELAKKPATRPELETKRAQLLGYLDDYIAKGTTPENTRLPWRSPVFIDDFGTICAVGYLIERSVGREVAEKIASAHRYEFLEDIAAAMPDVQQWVEASGFTLDELASIQPGYERPAIEEWGRWTLANYAEGTYHDAEEHAETKGEIETGKMEGEWKRFDAKGHVLGKGKMHAGAGTWHSFYPDGKKMAEGPYEKNDPHGQWTFFHRNGRVAAEGAFFHGQRHGEWKFFYDDAAGTLISKGSFNTGSIVGDWEHFDREGELLATSVIANTPHQRWGEGFLLTVTKAHDGVRHQVHRLGGPDNHRVDGYYLGDEKIYVHNDGKETFDANGFRLEKTELGWEKTNCKWSKKRKIIAQRGDIVTLHGLISPYAYEEAGTPCEGQTTKVEKDRAKRLDKIAASFKAVREKTPEFARKLALGEKVIPTDGDDNYDNYFNEDEKELAKDLPSLLAEHMAWYIEWPHVDGKFVEVFYTLAGQSREWGPNGGQGP